MLNDAQNISTSVPIQYNLMMVHHEAPCCDPFLDYISIQCLKCSKLDSFFRFEKTGTFFNMEHIGF